MKNIKLNFYWVFIYFLFACTNNDSKDLVLIQGSISKRYHHAFDSRMQTNPAKDQISVVVAYYQKCIIKDAIVEISTDSQVVRLFPVEEEEFTVYRDTNCSLQLIPGKTYCLYVELHDGRIFRSKTRLPNDPLITSPNYGDTLTLNNELMPYPDPTGILGARFKIDYYKDQLTYAQLFEFNYHSQKYQHPVVSYRYSITDLDSPYVILRDNEVVKKSIVIFTLDSALSYYSWRYAKFWFGVDSLYDDLYSKYSELSIKKYSNIEGERAVGCFGSYSSTEGVYYFKQ